MLLKEIRTLYNKELKELYSQEEITHLFQRITEHFLGLAPFVLALNPHTMLQKDEEQVLFESLAALKLEKPLQYITGEAHFFGLKFKVSPGVLIPRPETEELVAWIVEELQGKAKKEEGELRILDMGTGSGCIAITLAKEFPNAEVYAIDISENALAMANANAQANEVVVHFLQEDILSLEKLNKTFDIIVSNPPYVREMEKETIKNNVKNYEPSLALFVPDENPLVFYERIAHFAKKNLKQGGVLYVELNEFLGMETKRLLEAQNFSEIELRKDLFEKDRMLKGILIY